MSSRVQGGAVAMVPTREEVLRNTTNGGGAAVGEAPAEPRRSARRGIRRRSNNRRRRRAAGARPQSADFCIFSLGFAAVVRSFFFLLPCSKYRVTTYRSGLLDAKKKYGKKHKNRKSNHVNLKLRQFWEMEQSASSGLIIGPFRPMVNGELIWYSLQKQRYWSVYSRRVLAEGRVYVCTIFGDMVVDFFVCA